MLTGCAISGPLSDLDGFETCQPSREGTDVFFGAPLTNTGDKEITILDVVVKDSANTAAVEFGVDETAVVVGTAYYPDDTAGANPESMSSIEFMVAPQDATIKADHTAGLLFKIVPQDPALAATVSNIAIKYQVAGTTYTATNKTTFTVAPLACF